MQSNVMQAVAPRFESEQLEVDGVRDEGKGCVIRKVGFGNNCIQIFERKGLDQGVVDNVLGIVPVCELARKGAAEQAGGHNQNQ